MIDIAHKNISSYVPTGLLMDLSCIYTFEDDFYNNNEIRIWVYNYPIISESRNILLAKYPKNSKLGEGIIVDPRYANEKDFDFFEVKGFRHGRTIDILAPNSALLNGDYSMLNIKGVGAFADKKFMIFNPESWYMHNENEWKPFHEVMDKSLGRRWGMLDSYSGEKEFNNNVFSDYGIAQSPHLKFNKAPEGLLPFEGITQLVRGLKTNMRCNLVFDSKDFQERYIEPENFSAVDAKIFAFQKELYLNNKGLEMFGTIPDNRYIDGNFTDTENISILPQSDEAKRLSSAYRFIKEVMSSAFMAMSKYDDGRKQYLCELEEKTGIPLTKYLSLDPELLFMRRYMDNEEYLLKHGTALSEFRTNMKKDLSEYFRS